MKALVLAAALVTLVACGAAPGTSSPNPVSNRSDTNPRESSRPDNPSGPARDPGGRSHGGKGK